MTTTRCGQPSTRFRPESPVGVDPDTNARDQRREEPASPRTADRRSRGGQAECPASHARRSEPQSVDEGACSRADSVLHERERDGLSSLHPIGIVRSPLKDRATAPSQGSEGAPDAARRDVLKLHPRWDGSLPLTGGFATRSPDRPNLLGLHRVTVLEVAGRELKVGPLEAIDGTPVVDLKPVLRASADS